MIIIMITIPGGFMVHHIPTSIPYPARGYYMIVFKNKGIEFLPQTQIF